MNRPYYEESAKVQSELNTIKARIEQLSKIILESKKSYSKTLKDLENISEEIHEKRAQLIAKSFKREPGVGAELENTSNKIIGMSFSEIYNKSQFNLLLNY